MLIILIENREKIFKLLFIKLFLHTVVRQSIAVFLFLGKYNIHLNISDLLRYENKYVRFHENARGYIHMRSHFLRKFELHFIRDPPVLFEHKKSIRTEDLILSKDISDNYECRTEEENGVIKYFAKLINDNDSDIEIEISERVYNELNKNHRDDSAQGRKARRHNEKSELTENNLHKKGLFKVATIDESLLKKISNAELHKAIDSLKEKQRRRVYMYYFEGLKLREIAEYEGCSPTAIWYSLEYAKNNLHTMLYKKIIDF